MEIDVGVVWSYLSRVSLQQDSGACSQAFDSLDGAVSVCFSGGDCGSLCWQIKAADLPMDWRLPEKSDSAGRL